MKTRLLRNLRREANEHFKFKITCNDNFAFVESRGKWVASFFNEAFNKAPRERATIYCKDHIRCYILGRVRIIKASIYF